MSSQQLKTPQRTQTKVTGNCHTDIFMCPDTILHTPKANMPSSVMKDLLEENGDEKKPNVDKKEPAKEEASVFPTRVYAPPGGFSKGFW